MKRQLLMLPDLREQVLHVVELALVVPVRIVDMVIDRPVLTRLGIDVHAVD